MIQESNSRSLSYSNCLHLSFEKLKQSVTKYCSTTPFLIKKYAYSLPPFPLFHVERVWKLFGIALMAAWYIWEA